MSSVDGWREAAQHHDMEAVGAEYSALGAPATTIVDYAVATATNLIVMGTHGRTGLAHLLMGSVAEHVVRTAECPVLTVRRSGVVDEAGVPVLDSRLPMPA